MISFRDFFFQIQINFEQNSFSSVYLEIFTYVAIMVRDTFHLTVLFKNRKIVDCSNKNRKLYEILIATVWTGILLFFLIIRYSNFKLFWFCWQYFFPIMFSHLSCLYSYISETISHYNYFEQTIICFLIESVLLMTIYFDIFSINHWHETLDIVFLNIKLIDV